MHCLLIKWLTYFPLAGGQFEGHQAEIPGNVLKTVGRRVFELTTAKLFIIWMITLDLELTPGDTLSPGGESMKISEVSERYGISTDTLRYYERIGLLPPVNRNGSGVREFNDIDLRRVAFIKCMRGAGLSIEVLIGYVRLVQQGDQTIEARKEILKEQRGRLAARMKDMQETLDLLDYKINAYQNTVLQREHELSPVQDI